MEYKTLTPEDSNYPRKLKERLGPGCPAKLYYNGPLEYLDKFTMAVVSTDSIGGVGLMAANQVLFTIREYEMNYIGPWQSVMETEIFRLGLWKKCKNTVTLFSAKGLASETYEKFLLDRFYPPFDKFPERDEYFNRARNGKLLIFSVTEPSVKRYMRQNIIKRNWVLCNLGDIVFIPYGVKGSKTFSVAKRLLKASNIPVFTTESDVNKDLHDIGVSGFNRKTVRAFLEQKGVKLAFFDEMSKNKTVELLAETKKTISYKPQQIEIKHFSDNKKNGKLRQWRIK
ncbi:MAG: hypothetical protein AB1633_05445 [Elusimicrobiota bacterium]